MSNIQQNLANILSSRYGRDVRQAIHDGIHNCYEDGKAGSVDLVARELIQQKMSGSPAGTYANLAALISADPDHSKIYITLDDGNWCYHNGSAFVAGGVYQTSLLPDKIAQLIPGASLPDYNTATNVLDFKSIAGTDQVGVYCMGQWYWLPEGTTVTNTVTGTSARVLWFDFETKTFSFKGYNIAPNSSEFFLGTLKGWITSIGWSPIWTGMFDMTIDGVKQATDQEKDDTFFFMPSSLLPDYNSTTKILDFKSASLSDPNDTAGIYFDSKWYWIPSGTTVDCSTGGSTSAKMLIFDKITKVFHVEAYDYPVSLTEIIIGTFKRNIAGQLGVKWTLPFAITVDGISQNSSGESPLPDVDANKISDFCELFKTIEGDAQSFLFFTDAHTFNLPAHETNFKSELAIIESAYKNTPTSCVIFGGDWTSNSATKRQACTVLGKIDAITNTRFDGKFYNVLGNHDTNYQGRDLPESANGTGTLTERAITNLLYRDYGKSYYTFKQGNSTNYVMDSGIDWVLTMDAYRWEQVDWFAKGLKSDDSDHSALFMHIGWNVYEHDLVPMTDEVTKIANAYNTRASITSNGITYDFSTCTGTFSFVYTGHMHEEDYDALINGIRVVTTMHSYKSTPHTFDLCLVDYAAQKLKTVRIGFGDNRSIDIS